MTENIITVLSATLPSVEDWGSKPSGQTYDDIVTAIHDWFYSFLPFLGRGSVAAIIGVLLVFIGAWAVLAWIRGH